MPYSIGPNGLRHTMGSRGKPEIPDTKSKGVHGFFVQLGCAARRATAHQWPEAKYQLHQALQTLEALEAWHGPAKPQEPQP